MNLRKANLGQLLYLARYTSYRKLALKELERRMRLSRKTNTMPGR